MPFLLKLFYQAALKSGALESVTVGALALSPERMLGSNAIGKFSF